MSTSVNELLCKTRPQYELVVTQGWTEGMDAIHFFRLSFMEEKYKNFQSDKPTYDHLLL